jgi:hypothetical protein
MRVTMVAQPFAAVAASLMLVSAGACSPAALSARPAGSEAAAFVEVTNSSWFDVVVYGVRSGVRWRLGMVGSMNTETFRIPQHDLLSGSGLRLIADPIGSPEVFVFGTDPGCARTAGRVDRGVELTVAPRLAQSYFAVR